MNDFTEDAGRRPASSVIFAKEGIILRMKASHAILRISAGMALLFALAACSASPGWQQSAASPSPSASPAGAPTSTAPAQRIVSTTVAITEIMDALGVDLVGVPTSGKTLPARYKGLTDTGNPMDPDMEVVRLLKPTEVLSVSTLEYDLKPKFANAGVQASFLDLTSLAAMSDTIRALGQKYGKQQQAEAVVQTFAKQVDAAIERVKGKPAPKVLILLGIPGSYLVATEHSYIGDLVKRAGGVNVVQGESAEFVASNTEHLQQANPDVILRAAHGLPDEVVKMFDKEFQKNDIWKHFNAVANKRVYDLDETLFGTTGNLAVGQAMEKLAGMLYP